MSSASSSNSSGSSSTDSCAETKKSRDGAVSGHATSHAMEAALQKAPAPAAAGTTKPPWKDILEDDERGSTGPGRAKEHDDNQDAEGSAAQAGAKPRERWEGQKHAQSNRQGKGQGGDASLAAGVAAGVAATEDEVKDISAPSAPAAATAAAPRAGSTRRTRKGTWAAPATEAPLLRSTSSGTENELEREKGQPAEAPETTSSAGATGRASAQQDGAMACAQKGAQAQPVACRTRSSTQKGGEALPPAAEITSEDQSRRKGRPASSSSRRGKSQEKERGRGQESEEKDEKENQKEDPLTAAVAPSRSRTGDAYGEEAPAVGLGRLDSDTSSSLPGTRQAPDATVSCLWGLRVIEVHS